MKSTSHLLLWAISFVCQTTSTLAVENACSYDEECFHGGYCDDGGLSNDPNHPHIYDSTCKCTSRYTGPYCETLTLDANDGKCVSNLDCQNGGTCNLKDSTCQCTVSYYGFQCENLCPCRNSGSCQTIPETGAFQCICNAGFDGETCSIAIATEEEVGTNPILLAALLAVSSLLLVLMWRTRTLSKFEPGVEKDATLDNHLHGKDDDGDHNEDVEKMDLPPEPELT